MHFFSPVTNNGIAETVPCDMKAAVAAFCELHLDEKMKYASGSYSLQLEARLCSLRATKARLV